MTQPPLQMHKEELLWFVPVCHIVPWQQPHLHCSQHVMLLQRHVLQGSTVLSPSRQDKLTQTKPIHLTWMPRLPFSIFAFGAAGFCPGSLSLLLTDLNHQLNKATSSLLCFAAFLEVFPSVPTRSTFFLILVELFWNTVNSFHLLAYKDPLHTKKTPAPNQFCIHCKTLTCVFYM